MVSITRGAVSGFRELLETGHPGPGEGLKLVPCCQGGLGMTIAEPEEADEIICREPGLLVAVDAHVAALLQAAVIDCERIKVRGRYALRFTVGAASRDDSPSRN